MVLVISHLLYSPFLEYYNSIEIYNVNLEPYPNKTPSFPQNQIKQ